MIPQITPPKLSDLTKGYVYRLWYGEKYLIVKCKTLYWSLKSINTDIERYFKNTKSGRSDNNDNSIFYGHIFANPELEFRMDIILMSDNPYQLLKQEVISLEWSNDPDCCNKTRLPYIPDDISKMKTGSWINRGHYLNFKKWYAKHTSLRQATATNGS